MLLLLQLARWDASGRLVARDLLLRKLRNTVDLDTDVGENNLVANISFPFCHPRKGRDLFLLRTILEEPRGTANVETSSAKVSLPPSCGIMDLQPGRS